MINITDTAQLGQIIRTNRKEQELTQKQLAAVCGVGERFIRELEQGKESCHIGKAMQVIDMLGLDFHLSGGSEQ